MSIFIGSTESLTVTLDAAPTNQLPCTASYVDQGGLGGDSAVNTTGVTAVTLVGPPASGVERLVSNIMIHNSDVATRIITVSKGSFLVGKFTVLAGNHLCYDGGWKVLDASGNFLCNVTVTGGTLTANQGAAAAITAPWPVELSNGTNAVGTASAPLRTDPTGTTTQPVSIAGTLPFNLTQVDSVALGAPVAYGSTPTGNAISVNAFVTNGGAGGSSNITEWNSVALGSPSNYGTSPGAVEVIGTNAFVTNTVTVDDTTANLAQASTTSGQTGVMAQGAATTAAPTYTTAKTYPLSLNLAGGLRVDGSGVTQPVSGTVAATQSGAWTVQPGNTANTTAWLVTGTGGTFPSTQSGTWNVGLSAGSNTIGTVNQGTANATPWNENIAQWGGTATSLGQKVSASSVPVVLASDYYPTGASCVTLTGTTAQTFAAATAVVIRSISVTSVGAVLAAGTVGIQILDGGGTLRTLFTVPTAVTTAGSPWTFDVQNLATPLVNGGNVSTIKLTANLTSGSFVVGFSL